MGKEKELREKVLDTVKEYYNFQYGSKDVYAEGDRINYAGRVFDDEEMTLLVDSALDFWLTAGRYVDEFEKSFSKFLGVKFTSLVNSGSSANLVAFMALTSHRLGDRRIKKGDEVIAVAAAFPTTVTPIVGFGAVPVFVDVELPTYNIDCSKLKDALSDKTKAVMVAHTLGNPFDLFKVKEFCDENNLWLIEDNCDALGSQVLFDGELKYSGTVGDIGTSSFYPPHHMTMGEGGAVYTNNGELYKIINSFRDWGRDCWCPSGRDNTCGKRFTQKFSELPEGYDHKYVYSHFGYNLKVTEMQAAIGCAQLKKLPNFIKCRKKNWQTLKEGLECLNDKFILPEATKDSEPSWFGFMLTIREGSEFKRNEIVNYLEEKGIQTRTLFSGNLIKHPCFDEIRSSGEGYRVSGELKNTDLIMNNSFWVGVYPGLTEDQVNFMITAIKDFFKER